MKRFMLYLIRGYRAWISPTHAPCCRYTPTCSSYALEALEKHGAWKGGLMSLWRVLRCNPFSRGGYDPVPDTWPAPRRKKASYNN